MKRIVVFGLAVAFAAASISTADARRGGGGGMRGGGARMGGGMSRPSSSMSRPSGGFNFSNDIGKPGGPGGVGGVGGPGGPGGVGGVGGPGGPGGVGGVGGPGGPGGVGGVGGPGRPGGRPIAPITPPLPAWGWNGGYAWYPAPMYWGGGFWGGFTTAFVFGEYYDEESKEKHESYQVAPDSPGAKVLAAYGLTQKPCGNPDMVVIHGPNNSVVCAEPNSTIGAGQYQLDTTNLTLSSAEKAPTS